MKAAGVVLAMVAGAGASDHAGPVHRPRHRGRRSRAGRGGLRGADVGAGDRAAGRHVRRAGAGRAVDAASSASAGWRRRWSGFWPGVIGTQFIVAQPLPRFVVFFAATVAARGGVHRAVRAARTCRPFGAAVRGRRRAGARQRAGRGRRLPAGRAAAGGGGAAAGCKRPDPPVDLRTSDIEEVAHGCSRRPPAGRRPADRSSSTSIAVVFSVLAVSFWVLQVVQHEKFEEMAENNHQRTLALRAPRGVVFDRDGQRARREPPLLQHLDRSRAHARISTAPSGMLAAVARRRRSRRPRDRRAPPPRAAYRPIVIVQDATLAQVAAVTARRLIRAAGRRRRAGADAAVSRRRWRRTCSATSARSTTRRSRSDETLKSGDIVGQSGIEKIYNALLMGEDGAKRVVVNSVGREIRDARGDRCRPKASGCS